MRTEGRKGGKALLYTQLKNAGPLDTESFDVLVWGWEDLRDGVLGLARRCSWMKMRPMRRASGHAD
jgi:hypothetical protein